MKNILNKIYGFFLHPHILPVYTNGDREKVKEGCGYLRNPNYIGISYDQEEKFAIGQKVFVTYHNIWNMSETLFQPPQAGIIVKPSIRKEHHFSKTTDMTCIWYWVKFSCGTFEIPATCIMDLKVRIESEKRFIENNKDSVGTRGNSIEAYNKVLMWLHDAETFDANN